MVLGRIEPGDAATAVLGALAANSMVKLVVAFASGGARFGWRVLPGVVLLVAGFAAGSVGPAFR